MTTSLVSQTSGPATSPTLWPWRPIYEGVHHAVGASLVSLQSGGAMLQRVTALRVDLGATGIDFRTTPAAGGGNGLTTATTMSDFLESTAGVVLAINANLSGPPLGTPSAGDSQLVGLAATESNIVCDPTQPPPGSSTGLNDVPDQTYVGCTALMIYGQPGGGRLPGNFTATIALATAATPPTTDNLYAAIAGSRNGVAKDGVPRTPSGTQIPFLIAGGEICAMPSDDTFAAGRTAVGVSENGTTLFLVVVEGLEYSHPPYGATFTDLAYWMAAAGSGTTKVWTAVSLDGGGSSVMAKLDPKTSRAVPLNIQYGDETTPGAQRCVGNYFGIIALPLS